MVWASTVISEISTLNIGSRPASRKKTRKIEDLRAIPWVFSWAQCRLMLPGWYGFGTAVKTWIAEHPTDGIAVLKAMYREWPFFKTLLSNMDMVLSKSSIAIASRYAELVADVVLREAIFERIRREHYDLIETLLAVTDHRKLLEDNPLLDRSIRNRFPYLDPLNHIQIELLKQHRASGVNEQVLRGIQLTINGISAPTCDRRRLVPRINQRPALRRPAHILQGVEQACGPNDIPCLRRRNHPFARSGQTSCLLAIVPLADFIIFRNYVCITKGMQDRLPNDGRPRC